MKKLIILVSVLVMSSLIFAQSASIYDQVGVPTYETKELYVEGDDLLHFHKTGDDYSKLTFNLGGVFNSWRQNADFDLSWGNMLDLDYSSETVGDADADAVTIMNDNLYANATKYFEMFQVFGDALFNFNKVTDIDATKYLDLTIGAGIGRIYDATPIAQAIVIINKLGGDVSDENILAVMDLLNSRAEYDAKYKDSGKVMWLTDIAKAAGGSEATLDVLKVLEDATPFGTRQYQISPRWVGWEVIGGFHNVFLTDADPGPKGDVFVQGRYAKPIGFDKSILAYLLYEKTLEDSDLAELEAGIDLWIDHDYTWSTNAGFSINKNMTPDNEDDMGMEFHAETIKNILGQLYGGAGLSYTKDYTAEDGTIDFNVFFRYLIF